MNLVSFGNSPVVSFYTIDLTAIYVTAIDLIATDLTARSGTSVYLNLRLYSASDTVLHLAMHYDCRRRQNCFPHEYYSSKETGDFRIPTYFQSATRRLCVCVYVCDTILLLILAQCLLAQRHLPGATNSHNIISTSS
jgi:hypothetical protein